MAGAIDVRTFHRHTLRNIVKHFLSKSGVNAIVYLVESGQPTLSVTARLAGSLVEELGIAEYVDGPPHPRRELTPIRLNDSGREAYHLIRELGRYPA